MVPGFRQEGAMRVHAIACAAVGALLTLSCSSVRPVAIQDGDQCFRCRRPIVEKAMAAELMDDNRFASKFRSSGCMAKYLADHSDETGTTFVTDYVTGKLVRPEGVLFVPVLNRDTGEGDYRAYLQKADADAAAAELHSMLIDWKTVLEKSRS
jgi:hypothetical protein